MKRPSRPAPCASRSTSRAKRHAAARLEVDVVSLESEREMPAMKSEQGREELEVAREESVSFIPSWGPKRIIVRDGKAVGIELVRCTRVFDDTGRFKPEFDESQRRTLEADTIILAIGQAPDLSFLKPEDGVETTPAGSLKIDPVTLATNIPGVFGGGDAAFPPSLLITCAQQGKLAARSIDAYLHGETIAPREMHVTVEELPTDTYEMTPRYEQIDRFIPIVPLRAPQRNHRSRTGLVERGSEGAGEPLPLLSRASDLQRVEMHPV